MVSQSVLFLIGDWNATLQLKLFRYRNTKVRTKVLPKKDVRFAMIFHAILLDPISSFQFSKNQHSQPLTRTIEKTCSHEGKSDFPELLVNDYGWCSAHERFMSGFRERAVRGYTLCIHAPHWLFTTTRHWKRRAAENR